MAERKPLVMVNGQIQQLQAGDTLDASVQEVDVTDLQNNNANPIAIGNVVYPDSGGVDLAQADAAATSEVLGLVAETSIINGESGAIQTDGILEATTGQWDAVAGTTGGLTPGAVYYLDASNAGQMTATAPTSEGEYVVRVGRAVSATKFEITMTQPVLL